MTPTDLFVNLMGATIHGFITSLTLGALVVIGVNVAHEIGHVISARLCGVQSIEFRIGKGPTWSVGTIKGCAVILGLAPFGGSVTYGPEIAMLGHTKRALIAAGGAAIESAICAIALLLAVLLPRYQWLWFVVWWTAFSASFAISPLHSDGRKVWFGV